MTTTPVLENEPNTQPIELPSMAFVTPEIATEWLAHNVENRPLRTTWVDALAREMTEGRWQMTGDPIRFDVDGHLIDGQHRLSAIVRADQPAMLFVLRNLPKTVRDVIDTGLVRSAADVLAFNEIKTPGLAAPIRVAMHRRDGFLQTARDVRHLKYTSSAILEFAAANPLLAEVAGPAYLSSRVVRVTSRAAWAYAMWELRKVNPTAQVEFENSLVESRTDGSGDPRLALLRYFARDAVREKNSRYYTPETLYVAFAAWNAWREGREVSRFQTVTGGTGIGGAYIPSPVV